jgi:molybdopterin converting factor small subunit
MARLLMFATAREASGVGAQEWDTRAGLTLGELLAEAVGSYGEAFAGVLATSRVWVNGEVADPALRLGPDDEVAVIPPIAGG